jgi:prophage tail gpP-like protein
MDIVYLLINGKRIDRFKSYAIDADLFMGAAAFTLELKDAKQRISPGQECELYVNDTLELTGIIDKVNPRDEKNQSSLTISGRDYLGVIADAHAEDFITVENTTLKSLTEKLLSRLPKIQRAAVEYQENVKGRIKSRASRVEGYDTSTSLSQIEPGATVFEVLSQYAKSKGLIFYALPHGSGASQYQPVFVFGRPKESGDPAFFLTRVKGNQGNNIKTSDLSIDISKQYSQVTVIGQKQGQDSYSATQNNIYAPVTDPTFPFYKPFILKDEYGGDQPKLQGRLALEKMRHDAFRAVYGVAGHSQNGKNWSINELCRVRDEKVNYELDDNYLIFGRTFKKSKDNPGTTTELRLGYKGMRG